MERGLSGRGEGEFPMESSWTMSGCTVRNGHGHFSSSYSRIYEETSFFVGMSCLAMMTY